MKKVQISPAPDWSEIFLRHPELEAPGYQEIFFQIRSKQPDFEAQRIREKMQQIHKEKTSAKNKNRSKRK